MLSRLGFLGVLLALTRSISLFGLLLALLWLEARQQAVVVSSNQKIYVFGGKSGNESFGHYDLNTVERFNPISNIWQTVSPMPFMCDWGCCVVSFGGTRS